MACTADASLRQVEAPCSSPIRCIIALLPKMNSSQFCSVMSLAANCLISESDKGRAGRFRRSSLNSERVIVVLPKSKD